MPKFQTRTMVVVDSNELLKLMENEDPEAYILGFSDSIKNYRHRITLSLNEFKEAAESGLKQEELFDNLKSIPVKEMLKEIEGEAGRPPRIFVIRRKFLHFEE